MQLYIIYTFFSKHSAFSFSSEALSVSCFTILVLDFTRCFLFSWICVLWHLQPGLSPESGVEKSGLRSESERCLVLKLLVCSVRKRRGNRPQCHARRTTTARGRKRTTISRLENGNEKVRHVQAGLDVRTSLCCDSDGLPGESLTVFSRDYSPNSQSSFIKFFFHS